VTLSGGSNDAAHAVITAPGILVEANVVPLLTDNLGDFHIDSMKSEYGAVLLDVHPRG
jgi:hypothetical protein